MKFAFVLAPLFAGLLAVPTADATGCVSRSRVIVRQQVVQAVAVKQAVIAPIAVAAFAAVPVTVPQYSVGYNPNGAAEGEITELRQAIQELREAIRGLRQPAAPPPEADDLQAKAARVLNNRCALCHSEGTAAKEGGGFVMFKGGQLNPALTRDDFFHMWERSSAGTMPPKDRGQPIPDDEERLLREWVSQKSKAERELRKAARTQP